MFNGFQLLESGAQSSDSLLTFCKKNRIELSYATLWHTIITIAIVTFTTIAIILTVRAIDTVEIAASLHVSKIAISWSNLQY